MTSDATAALERTAALYGVEAAWVDIEGRRRTAPPEVVLGALAALGAPVDGAGDLGDAARIRRLEIWRRVAPPVRVAAPGEIPTVPLRIPAEAARGRLRWRLSLEHGGVREGDARVDGLGLAGGSSVEGRRYEIRRLTLPGDLPPGRHRLVIRHAHREVRSHLVISPGRCHRSGRFDRSWGVFHPLYGLRDRGPGAGAGVGDLATLRAAARWTAERGGDLFGTTPLLAGFDEPPVDPSPYAPASRLFWDDRAVDLERTPGFAAAGDAGELREWVELEARREDPLVPWDALCHARTAALTALARRFFDRGGDRDRDFQAFLGDRGDAGDYARFRAACLALGRDWRRWPARARDGALDGAPLDPGAVHRHLFGQWVAARQIAAENGADAAGLYLDLPLGSHPDGYDAWRHRALFVDGVSAGAPPDDFFRGGQDWGLPPLHPRRLREDGYAYVAAVLAHAMRPAAMVRLDHVMQLHRVFWVPRGARPADGVYVRYPAEELAAVVALISDRHRCEVAGEDLGTVPDSVRELMETSGMRRSSVLGFSIDHVAEETGADPAGAAAGSVAMIATHDMVPLKGLRSGRDLAERAALGLLGPEEEERLRERRRAAFAVLDARFGVEPAAAGQDPDPLLAPLLEALGRGDAGVVLAGLDDLVGAEDPQNVPGTTDTRPNWRRRLPTPLGELGDGVDRLLSGLAAARGREGT